MSIFLSLCCAVCFILLIFVMIIRDAKKVVQRVEVLRYAPFSTFLLVQLIPFRLHGEGLYYTY